jgi:hypothetical protein
MEARYALISNHGKAMLDTTFAFDEAEVHGARRADHARAPPSPGQLYAEAEDEQLAQVC